MFAKIGIALGSDHVGFPLKETLREYLVEKGFNVKDFGTNSIERMDYPLVAKQVALAVQKEYCQRGILICGTGVGMAIAANKHKGVRAAVCSEPFSAQMASAHNNANVLALGSRVVGLELAKMIVNIWLETPYEGGRHQNRLDMICAFES
jgi:ribose 5-phosphate isomerase B